MTVYKPKEEANKMKCRQHRTVSSEQIWRLPLRSKLSFLLPIQCLSACFIHFRHGLSLSACNSICHNEPLLMCCLTHHQTAVAHCPTAQLANRTAHTHKHICLNVRSIVRFGGRERLRSGAHQLRVRLSALNQHALKFGN